MAPLCHWFVPCALDLFRSTGDRYSALTAALQSFDHTRTERQHWQESSDAMREMFSRLTLSKSRHVAKPVNRAVIPMVFANTAQLNHCTDWNMSRVPREASCVLGITRGCPRSSAHSYIPPSEWPPEHTSACQIICTYAAGISRGLGVTGPY